MEGTTLSTSLQVPRPTSGGYVIGFGWVAIGYPGSRPQWLLLELIEEHQVRPPSKTDHSPMLFLLALLAIVASSYAFRSFGARSASISSARFLFGTPDPKKDEMKKSEGGGGISDPLYCLNIAQGCSEAWVTSWTR